MTTKNSNSKTISVLNKKGYFLNKIDSDKAAFSVKSNKSIWVNERTIKLLYDKQDEKAICRIAWEIDNYTCYLCGLEMCPSHPLLTVDHLVPRRLGGSILLDNIYTCCRQCNGQKAYRLYKHYFLDLYAYLCFMVLWWRNKEGRINSGKEKTTKK